MTQPVDAWITPEAEAGLAALGEDADALWREAISELRGLRGDAVFEQAVALAAVSESRLLGDAVEELTAWATLRQPTALACLGEEGFIDTVRMMVMAKAYRMAARAPAN